MEVRGAQTGNGGEVKIIAIQARVECEGCGGTGERKEQEEVGGADPQTVCCWSCEGRGWNSHIVTIRELIDCLSNQ